MTTGQSFGAYVRRVQAFYGFAAPYDFDRALPFVVAGLLAAIVALLALGAVSMGALNWGTFRFVFFIYLFLAALLAAGLAFSPKWSWGLSALCFLELVLGFGSQLLADNQTFVEVPLLPLNESLGAPEQYQFHPLLQIVPSANYAREKPFAIRHDSAGLRGAERDRNRLGNQIVVAAIGGSSTYDIALPNGQTWPDVLEGLLGRDYAVLNHGVPGYSTSEHILQTAFYLDAYHVKPQCAVYYVGYNDVHNAYLPRLDSAYADYHMLLQARGLEAHNNTLVARISPIARIAIPWMRYLLTTTPLPQDFSSASPGHGGDVRLEDIYRSNLRSIVALNRSRQVATIFIGQVVNLAKVKNIAGPWFPFIRGSSYLPLQTRFNQILAGAAKTLIVPVLIPRSETFTDADFVDDVHFSPRGARRFAALIEPIIKANCRK